MNTKDTIQKDTEAGHTPGPWEARNQDAFLYIFGADGNNIARIYGHGKTVPRDANARLIAAAPELLEACKAALELATANLYAGNAQVEKLLKDAIHAATKSQD